VQRFHDEGATVVVSDYSGADAESLIGELGGRERLIPLAFDVSDPAAVEAAFDQIEATTGPIDHLVNSAGMANIAGTVDLEPEMWRKVHAVNLDGTFYVSKAFASRAQASGRAGSIVNLASVAGMLAIPDRPAYISSKHAVVGLTREMAMEFGVHDIRVNAVAPGIIRTPMSEAHFQDPERSARINRAHALGRGGYPEEVAAAIAFLCSDDASFISGAILAVDGGYSAGKAW
jgi:meso-butanediol dehydrogenase/(S,S)-butanediol dehydrogenase/diacetyl reductase